MGKKKIGMSKIRIKDNISSFTHNIVIKISERFEPFINESIKVKRLRDINLLEPSDTSVCSVEFHQSEYGMLLTAELDKTLDIFQFNTECSEKLRSITFEDFFLCQASFILEKCVLCVGKKPLYYLYDIEKENSDKAIIAQEKTAESFVLQHNSPTPLAAFITNECCIPIISPKAKLVVGQLESNDIPHYATFTGEHGLWTVNDRNIYHWDLRMQRCTTKFVNDGALKVTAMASPKHDKWLAIGFDTGQLNLFDSDELLTPSSCHSNYLSSITPMVSKKIFTTTTSTIDTIKISSDGNLLLVASRMKRDFIRLFNVPSTKIFSDWPTNNTPIGYVYSAAFCPRTELLAIGNSRGRTPLFKIK